MNQLAKAQERGAAELVQRARAFDQNAIGMIDSIRKNAQLGQETAKSAFSAIAKYIQDHPVQADMGAEVKTVLGRIKHPNNSDVVKLGSLGSLPSLGDVDAIHVACILLTQGPAMSNGRITRMHEIYPTQSAKDVFEFGLDNCGSEAEIGEFRDELSESLEGVLCAGYCVGIARRLQLVALGKMPAGSLSRGIAWELGQIDVNEELHRAVRAPKPSAPLKQGNIQVDESIFTFTTPDERVVRRKLW